MFNYYIYNYELMICIIIISNNDMCNNDKVMYMTGKCVANPRRVNTKKLSPINMRSEQKLKKILNLIKWKKTGISYRNYR